MYTCEIMDENVRRISNPVFKNEISVPLLYKSGTEYKKYKLFMLCMIPNEITQFETRIDFLVPLLCSQNAV